MRKRLLTLLLIAPFLTFAQLNLGTTGRSYTIDFDAPSDWSTHNGDYEGEGFRPNPGPGQLSSNAWALYDGGIPVVEFGDTAVTFNSLSGRGTSNGGETTDGVYGYNIFSPFQLNRAVGWQMSSSFNPELTLRVVNNSGNDINFVRFGYLFAAFNDGNRAVEMNASFSFDNSSYQQIPGLSETSDETADLPGSWSYAQSFSLVNFDTATSAGDTIWAAGDTLFLSFSSQSVGGSGVYDEVALDNVTITGFSADFVYQNDTWTPYDPSDTTNVGSDALIFPSTNPAVLGGTTTILNGIIVLPGGKLFVPDSTILFAANFMRMEADEIERYSQLLGEVTIGGQPSSVDTFASYEVYLEQRFDGGGDEEGRWYNVAFPTTQTSPQDIKGVPVQANGSFNTSNLWYYDNSQDTVDGGDGSGDFLPVPSLAFSLDKLGLQLYAGDGEFFGTGPFLMRSLGNEYFNGPVDITVYGDNDGYNLLPNPYPSTLVWDDVVSGNPNLGSTYYIQNGYPDTAGTSVFEYYFYQNGGTGNTTGPYIAPVQSFFAQWGGTGSGFVTMDNSMRTLDQEPSRRSVTPAYPIFSLRANYLKNSWDDVTFVKFDGSFADSENIRQDAEKMMNRGVPNLYTEINGVNFAINAVSDQFTSRTIDLHFQGDFDGFYEIALDQDAVPQSWTIELEDLETGNIVDVRKSTYLFQHNSGNDVDRFKLHINKSGVGLAEQSENSEIYSYLEQETLNVAMQDVEDATVKVYDVNGRLLVDEENVSNRFHTSTSAWASGVYIVEVVANGTTLYNNKIVKP